MKLLFDEDLIEAALFRWADGKWPESSPPLIRRFHADRERCYSILDPDERNAAFNRVHRSWFVECGLRERLESCARLFPPLSRSLDALAFRQARAKSDEGAELYVNPEGQRQGIVALRPDRLAHHAALARWLHHELMHLSDMLDPDFDYSPSLDSLELTTGEQRCVRERYRLLWDITIDGRLAHRQLPSIEDQTSRRAEFDRGYAFLTLDRRGVLFADLWSGRLARHALLLKLAADPRALSGLHTATPGAHCSLCGFSAFEWADPHHLPPAALPRIHAEFPNWLPTHGLCARCAEIYTAAFGFELPPTVCLG
jgi:hypothetical protein